MHRRPRLCHGAETVKIIGGRACIAVDVWGALRPAVKGRGILGAMVLYLALALKPLMLNLALDFVRLIYKVSTIASARYLISALRQ
jgi:hypothetical protein